MVKKLLKYDLRSMFKIWWIIAAVVSSLFVVCGFTCTYLESESNVLLTLFAVLVMIFTIFGGVALSISPYIISAVRIYRNLFTDEGYLTFTLPVKKKDIINSKLIAASILHTLSAVILVVDLFVLLAIVANTISDYNLLKSFFDFLSTFFKDFGFWGVIIILELLVCLILTMLINALLIFVCITIGATITKKGKALAAFGIYYGVNSVASFLIQMVAAFIAPSVFATFITLPNHMISPCTCLILFIVLLFCAIIATLFYMLQYYLIDRKLNLS